MLLHDQPAFRKLLEMEEQVSLLRLLLLSPSFPLYEAFKTTLLKRNIVLKIVSFNIVVQYCNFYLIIPA